MLLSTYSNLSSLPNLAVNSLCTEKLLTSKPLRHQSERSWLGSNRNESTDRDVHASHVPAFANIIDWQESKVGNRKCFNGTQLYKIHCWEMERCIGVWDKKKARRSTDLPSALIRSHKIFFIAEVDFCMSSTIRIHL